jgi:hypothetical protein
VRLGGGARQARRRREPDVERTYRTAALDVAVGRQLYFALALECRLSLGLGSFPRPTVQARSPPNSDIGDLDSLVHPGDRKELAWPRATGE